METYPRRVEHNIGTRGITIEKLSESEWLTGPSWLEDHPDERPLSLQPINVIPDDDAEVAVIAITSMSQELPVYRNKFSYFSKCVRVIAFCLCLKYTSQSKIFLVEYLNRAEERVLKTIQGESFPELSNEKDSFGRTTKGGTVSKFAPLFDEKGVIRFRGRIKHANLGFGQRHPVLLFTNHECLEYVGIVMEQKLWIIGLRYDSRSIKSNCVLCRTE